MKVQCTFSYIQKSSIYIHTCTTILYFFFSLNDVCCCAQLPVFKSRCTHLSANILTKKKLICENVHKINHQWKNTAQKTLMMQGIIIITLIFFKTISRWCEIMSSKECTMQKKEWKKKEKNFKARNQNGGIKDSTHIF
jgi:hypothetical protein